MQVQAKIHVTGIVQGVGFRPFVYRTAVQLNLVGYVLNLGDAGVEILVEGESQDITKLIKTIREHPPSISRVDSVDVIWGDASGDFSDFSIKKSDAHRSPSAAPEIPPDIGICDDCVRDVFTQGSRWYHYPFTSCAACGPRYSTITDLPYDRPNTTMSDFPLCDICNTGYTDPRDRRYHAQTTACPSCGPRYHLLDKTGATINEDDAVEEAARLIVRGFILVVHGIGGTHLVTKTSDVKPILELRRRKNREARPFAIMVKDIESTRKLAEVSEREASLLTSWRRPIVLVKKRVVSPVTPVLQLFEALAPGIDTLGVMLPYSAVHHLLFEYTNELALVMTSGNPSGIPMYIDAGTITGELKNIADYFLVHNRRIAQRIDDSVMKPIGETEVFIRRSRGYVPDPIKVQGVPIHAQLIAVGPEEKATASVYKSGNVYLTQHIGNTDNIESLNFLRDAIDHLSRLTGIRRLDAVGCDLHPEFLSTEFAMALAEEREVPLIRTQHHHAHLVSLLVDNNISPDTSIVCITADGYGYGQDGGAWGGEVLVGNGLDFANAGGLEQHVLPGSDHTAWFPARSFIGILGIGRITPEVIAHCKGAPLGSNTSVTEESFQLLLTAMRNNINTIVSSSAGRLLDAVAFALGVSSVNSYDGESPMRLEAIAKESDISLKMEYTTERGRLVMDTASFLEDVFCKRGDGISIPELAYAAQWSLGQGFAEIAISLAEEEGLKHIGFSGGVALNRIITKSIRERVSKSHLSFLAHRRVPPGDGGISLGQAVHSAMSIGQS